MSLYYVQGLEDSIPIQLDAEDRATAVVEAAKVITEGTYTVNEIDNGVCFATYDLKSRKWLGKYAVEDLIAIDHKLTAVNITLDNIDHVFHQPSAIKLLAKRIESRLLLSGLDMTLMTGAKVIASSVGENSRCDEERTITVVEIEATESGWIVNEIGTDTLRPREAGYEFIYLTKKQLDHIKAWSVRFYETMI